MAMSNGPKITWSVTAQTDTQEFSQAGDLVNGKSVTFRTSTGYVGTVFITDAAYQDIGTVKDMIQAAAQQANAISGLSGELA